MMHKSNAFKFFEQVLSYSIYFYIIYINDSEDFNSTYVLIKLFELKQLK